MAAAVALRPTRATRAKDFGASTQGLGLNLEVEKKGLFLRGGAGDVLTWYGPAAFT